MKLVLDELAQQYDFKSMRVLHIAPEDFTRKHFHSVFGEYVTADIEMPDVDLRVDLRDLSIDDAQFDFVFASHVLEHIDDDGSAISEIHRILRPGGIAILPVPIVSDKTIEYPEPNPLESGHVRCPGPDYFDRYRLSFDRVVIHSSDEYPPEHQTYVYEDRSFYPTREMPYRGSMAGDRHKEYIPVCYA